MICDLLNPDIPTIMRVRAIPKSKVAKIKKEFDENGKILYKIYVTAPPEDGKANKAIIELIAKDLGIAKSQVTIASGHHCRDKIVHIEI
jgi:uncharacterized protein (TIGR00251 family)